jgi:hypothetical protein
MQDKIPFLEKTLARLLEWIRAADAKIPPVLAITTSMLAVMAALLPKDSECNAVLAVAGTAAILLLFNCLLFLFLASFPRTQGPVGSILYFEGIKKHDPDSYFRVVGQLTDEEYSIDLAKQCHRNAEIAGSKYWHLKIAMTSLFLSVLPWLVFVFIRYKER